MRTRIDQTGITIIGFLFVAVVVLAVAMIGFRVLPAYIEYFSVQKILKQTLDNMPEGETLGQFQRDFGLRAGADYIDSVYGQDVDLVKEGNQLVASATWTKTLPLIGNASLLLDFTASATK
jgi:hypothetical protein